MARGLPKLAPNECKESACQPAVTNLLITLLIKSLASVPIQASMIHGYLGAARAPTCQVLLVSSQIVQPKDIDRVHESLGPITCALLDG